MQNLSVRCARLLRLVLPSIVFLATSGCAAVMPFAGVDVAPVLHDEAFPDSSEYRVESEEDVFGLDAAARLYLDENINSIRDFHNRGEALIDEIFHQAALNLSYESNANTTASETFHQRAANCLSLSILTYSMAEYVGFDANFQEVAIPEYWERRDNFSLMARHVNLLLKPKTANSTRLLKRSLEIDFLSPMNNRRYPVRVIPKARALAMFYNNKGVDALLNGRHDVAYAYLKRALLTDSTLDMAMTNLGQLYAAHGHLDRAETAYQLALEINDDNLLSAEGLALLMKKTGREEQANEILARVERKRQDSPYYHYIQGEEAYDDGDWALAIQHFKKAISLKPDADEFYFGLAKSYLRLGDQERAESSLRKAERHAIFTDTRTRYRNKINSLSDL